VTMDADETYPAELIGEYIEKLIETDSDFITIDRFARFCHKIGNKILSKTMNSIFSTVVNDSQSGMWIMKKAFANQINLMSDDMCMSEEIKIITFKYFRANELL
jgi:hypothetical protein